MVYFPTDLNTHLHVYTQCLCQPNITGQDCLHLTLNELLTTHSYALLSICTAHVCYLHFMVDIVVPNTSRQLTFRRIVMVVRLYSAMWNQAVVMYQLLEWGLSVDHVLLGLLEMEASV